MHRILVTVLLAFLATGWPATADVDDPVGRSLGDLASPFAGTRDRAVADLAQGGPDVETRLLAVYPTADYVTRSGILDALAARRSEAALPTVLDDLATPSRTVREAQARLLAALGDPARDAVRRVAEEGSGERAGRARSILPVLVRLQVERVVLNRTVGKPVRYRGQYAVLLPDRAEAIPVLLEMVAHENGGYRFESDVWLVVDALEIRALAAEALGDIGRPGDAVPLREIHDRLKDEMERTGNWRRRLELDALTQTLAYSLWDLGDGEPAERLAQELHDDLWEARGHGWAFSSFYNRKRSELAKTLLRMKRYERAEEIYRELLLHPDAEGVAPGLCAYNLACTLCLAGRQEDALSALLESARYDPSAGELALEDGDLRALRDRYPDLLERVREVAAEADPDGGEDR